MNTLRAKREALKARRLSLPGPSRYLEQLAAPSVRQYTDQQDLWETCVPSLAFPMALHASLLYCSRFKAQISEPDAVPSLDNLLPFAWLCAKNSKGRLAEHADVKTISFNIGRFVHFYNQCHEYHISDDDVKEVTKV